MAEFVPPSGPPPPKVPEGWKAVWNTQYSEWFFVNLYTKQSQWDKPTEPVYPPGEGPPDGPPPGYAPSASGALGSQSTGATEKSSFSSNNPYANAQTPASSSLTEDERLARKLQEEENAQHSGEHRSAANDYYNQPIQSQPGQYGGYPQQSASPYPQQAQTPYQDPSTQSRGKKGLLGKLLGKAGGSSSSHSYSQQQGYGQPAYGPAPGGYYGGGYQQRPMGYGMPPGRRPGGGMGTGGAMALGAGGGLLGGALIGSALADGGDGGNTYVENNYDGDYGGDGGGDFGGGDFGGGDF